MQVLNKETGETETMRHGPATEAVTAGTHEFVNVDQGNASESTSELNADIDGMTKDELIALAKERGVQHSASATKGEIVAALKSAG